MGSSYNQRDVVCPFYIRDDGRARIVCEGHYSDSRTDYTFSKKEAFERHLRTLCCNIQGCKHCAMFLSIMATKYGGEQH